MHVAATLPCLKENTHSPWKELEIPGGAGRERRGGNSKDKISKRKKKAADKFTRNNFEKGRVGES